MGFSDEALLQAVGSHHLLRKPASFACSAMLDEHPCHVGKLVGLTAAFFVAGHAAQHGKQQQHACRPCGVAGSPAKILSECGARCTPPTEAGATETCPEETPAAASLTEAQGRRVDMESCCSEFRV